MPQFALIIGCAVQEQLQKLVAMLAARGPYVTSSRIVWYELDSETTRGASFDSNVLSEHNTALEMWAAILQARTEFCKW